ncbi:MAG: repressor LexA [Clostridiales bacterium]|nr:repressor LexA [Clostridiales bacterium]
MRFKSEELIVKIKACIESFYFERGFLPTVREIASMCGTSKSNAAQYLSDMASRGLAVKTDDGYATNNTLLSRRDIVFVPKVGCVPCGPLTEEYEDIEEYVPLPTALTGRGEYFLLTASGDSMIKAGISDGDLLLIKRQQFAHNGDIAVALVNGEVTLKRFYIDEKRGTVVLHPENDNMDDIVVPECSVQGVAVKVIKDLTV